MKAEPLASITGVESLICAITGNAHHTASAARDRTFMFTNSFKNRKRPVRQATGRWLLKPTCQTQLGKRNDAMRVRQLKVPLAPMYWVVNQKVQSSAGSICMVE